MKRWYLAAAALAALGCPSVLMAQTSFSGTGTTGTGSTGTSGRGVSGSSTGGLAGTANTTLLGNTIDLNFNSVFGNQATIANTNGNIFAAYQPSGTSSTSGSRTGTGTGAGSFTGGFGSGTGTGTGTGFGGGTLGTTGLGTNANRIGTGGGLTGTLAGGIGGGALGNRNALGGGGMNAFGGNNRNMMGGQNFLGGTGFLGTGGAGNFLGSAANQQQGNNTVGYMVNVDNKGITGGSTSTLTSNTEMQQRLTSAPGLQGNVANLQVAQQGTTAVIRGQVSSDYAKQLAAAMLRLEPGVYEVDNQLEVVAGKK